MAKELNVLPTSKITNIMMQKEKLARLTSAGGAVNGGDSR